MEDKKSITRFILTLSRVFSYFLKGFDWDLTVTVVAVAEGTAEKEKGERERGGRKGRKTGEVAGFFFDFGPDFLLSQVTMEPPFIGGGRG